MQAKVIRKLFLEYFKNNNHEVVPSSSLVPYDDPTLLFVNSGMVQFKDVFLGHDKRNYQIATTVQRCVRAGGKHNDLKNVGYTARHHTFFEMLGNFSFGAYFKREAINFAWNFLTKELKIPAEKLWITVYKDDQEVEDIWLKELKVSKERFSRCGEKDNFWSMGDIGPCGPCSEIFYDHGGEVAGGPPGSKDEDGDRYIEIWNLVFMQFNRDANGNMSKLPKPSVDTGMGLERLAAVLQNVHSNYKIDLFQNLMRAIAKTIKVENHEETSIRVIADHIRSCAFMIVDDIVPSNEGRGYVLRRIIRRAIRHAHKLGFKQAFFYKIVSPLVKEMGEAYPELSKNQTRVEKILHKEETRFAETVEQGMKILNGYIAKTKGGTIDGEIVFKLYDTYGFPYDLTEDVARENNLKLDKLGFKKAMQNQQNMARAAGGFKTETKLNIPLDSITEFLGYQSLDTTSKIEKIFVDGTSKSQISQGETAELLLEQTSFYAESGGQIGDTGLLNVGANKFVVNDVQKNQQAIVHIGVLAEGSIKIGDEVKAIVNGDKRKATTCNHSATHLLHAALRQVLGDHISQKGSLVTTDKIRFDFSHDEPISQDTLLQIEALANSAVNNQLAVDTKLMSLDDAKKLGAIALFDEKYDETVRVLSMGDFSVELCGGTHVSNTFEIGLIKIINETSIAAGVRRIEAVSAKNAIKFLENSHQNLLQISQCLKTSSDNTLDHVVNLVNQNKQLEKYLLEQKQIVAKLQGSKVADNAVEINGVKVLVAVLENLDAKSLRNTMDDLKSKFNQGVILLATIIDDKISLVCGVTNNLTDRIKASEIMQNITGKIGGKGGGRHDMAQGGGTDIANLSNAMEEVEKWINAKL